MVDFVVIEKIPMLETGVEYPASTGPFTVSSLMLEEVILSQEDPHILPPRLKIGHSDNPINDDLQELWDDVNDGRDESKPSLGTITNMEITNAGQTLIGDFHGLPQWLADILMTAYPARSIEGGYWHNKANGKDYAFMLEALALLGVVGPGCTSLDDLQELFSDEGPKVTVIEMGTRPPVSTNPKEDDDAMTVVAQVNVEDIRRAFYDDFAQGDRYWWWDREILIDPNEMIVEDPEANQLFRLPIDLGEGEDAEVSFGDPTPIKIKYVPDQSAEADDKEGAKASRLIAPQLNKAGKVLAVNTTPPRDSERKKEASMDPKQVRESLGLPESATDEEVLAKMTELREAADAAPEPAPAPDGDPPAEGGDPDPAEPEADADKTPEPVAAGNDDGTRVIDKETLEKLQRDAASGVEARNDQIKAARTRELDQAQHEGRFPKARRDHYARMQVADPEGATKLLTAPVEDGGLAPGTVPVTEMGAQAGSQEMQSDAYDPNLLSPAERARIKAASEGAVPLVAKDQQEVAHA